MQKSALPRLMHPDHHRQNQSRKKLNSHRHPIFRHTRARGASPTLRERRFGSARRMIQVPSTTTVRRVSPCLIPARSPTASDAVAAAFMYLFIFYLVPRPRRESRGVDCPLSFFFYLRANAIQFAVIPSIDAPTATVRHQHQQHSMPTSTSTTSISTSTSTPTSIIYLDGLQILLPFAQPNNVVI